MTNETTATAPNPMRTDCQPKPPFSTGRAAFGCWAVAPSTSTGTSLVSASVVVVTVSGDAVGAVSGGAAGWSDGSGVAGPPLAAVGDGVIVLPGRCGVAGLPGVGAGAGAGAGVGGGELVGAWVATGVVAGTAHLNVASARGAFSVPVPLPRMNRQPSTEPSVTLRLAGPDDAYRHPPSPPHQ